MLRGSTEFVVSDSPTTHEPVTTMDACLAAHAPWHCAQQVSVAAKTLANTMIRA
ncbi:hypothetical protein AB0L63_04970 [Nocardia sp. NPDC051990]|uniref:hypothetical protein n=1 Tax=Nocardia sp. NPDC051990 TaxID=3155285 RepID=UPI003439544A